MKIALPRFGDEIAPWFDIASHLVVYEIRGEQPALEQVFVFDKELGVDRVRQLRVAGANVLICSGIGNKVKNMLQALGITVVNNISGSVEAALRAFYSGELCGADNEPIFRSAANPIPLRELVQSTQRLFKSHDCEISSSSDATQFPIDFVALHHCPTCGQTQRFAVCCGLRAYRVDDEIREFHQAAANAFDRKIYVHAPQAEIEKACGEYGISLLDPNCEKLPLHLIVHAHCPNTAIKPGVK
jgi:predicted Fe-Mo cluster-binding NifX family protein